MNLVLKGWCQNEPCLCGSGVGGNYDQWGENSHQGAVYTLKRGG